MADFKCGILFTLLVIAAGGFYFISYNLMKQEDMFMSVVAFILAAFWVILAMGIMYMEL